MTREEYYAQRQTDPHANKAPWKGGDTMLIFEDIECPLCPDKIKVIVENNKITSHGVCPTCDQTFSAEHLQFAQDTQAMEDQFMEHLSPEPYPDLVEIIEYEVNDFYGQLERKGVKI